MKTENTTSQPIILGYQRFEKFSAVEGITLSPRLVSILQTLDEKELVGEARNIAMRELLSKAV